MADYRCMINLRVRGGSPESCPSFKAMTEERNRKLLSGEIEREINLSFERRAAMPLCPVKVALGELLHTKEAAKALDTFARTLPLPSDVVVRRIACVPDRYGRLLKGDGTVSVSNTFDGKNVQYRCKSKDGYEMLVVELPDKFRF